MKIVLEIEATLNEGIFDMCCANFPGSPVYEVDSFLPTELSFVATWSHSIAIAEPVLIYLSHTIFEWLVYRDIEWLKPQGMSNV